MKLIIMRGISGAGKSTYISERFKDAVICSADLYFCGGDPNGEYRFDPKQLGAAHSYSRETCEMAMMEEKPLIVVDNTNTTLWEMKPYLRLAKEYDYEVEVIRLVCKAETAHQRNSHGVPLKSIEKMQARFEDYEDEWVYNTND